jgi:hypothetical protein
MDERQMVFLTDHFSCYNFEQSLTAVKTSGTLGRDAVYLARN